LTIEEEGLASHIPSKTLGSYGKIDWSRYSQISYVQQKETYNCEVPTSTAISQGFSAERKKSFMYAHKLEKGI